MPHIECSRFQLWIMECQQYLKIIGPVHSAIGEQDFLQLKKLNWILCTVDLTMAFKWSIIISMPSILEHSIAEPIKHRFFAKLFDVGDLSSFAYNWLAYVVENWIIWLCSAVLQKWGHANHHYTILRGPREFDCKKVQLRPIRPQWLLLRHQWQLVHPLNRLYFIKGKFKPWLKGFPKGQ